MENEPVETIYFGGGTPSLCSAADLEEIFRVIHTHYTVAANAEITLEANPDDLSRSYLHHLKRVGVNRLSIGIQSFFDDDLQWMNRAHNATQAHAGISNALEEGIGNISADLIFATPLLTDEKLEKNLETLATFNIPHISCYNLTIEERTLLHHEVKANKVKPVPDETASRQFYYIREFLVGRGYEHYEISNYAQPGQYSRHNTAYWQRKKYLGIGPSAHSYNGSERSWNVRSNEQYITKVSVGEVFRETEVLSPGNRFNEILMTGLRTQWGVDIGSLQEEFPQHYDTIEASVNRMIDEQFLQLSEGRLTLLPSSLILADHIASELFII